MQPWVDTRAVLWRNDEPKLMPIIASDRLEFIQVGSIGARAVGLRRLPVASDPLSNDVAQVGLNGPWTGRPEYNESRFDDDSTRLRTER